MEALLDALFESQLFVMRVGRLNRLSMDKLDERWTGANSARRAQKLDRQEAARFYREAGLSAPQIGIRIARDEGRAARPYSERQVRRWLNEKG